MNIFGQCSCTDKKQSKSPPPPPTTCAKNYVLVVLHNYNQPKSYTIFRLRIDIRLVGGSSGLEGRVEVKHDGKWGTVCDDLWDPKDARVVCRSLGYAGASPFRGAFFGQGTGDIILDSVACNGNEASIFSCAHDGIRSHDCDHGEDAGVRCQTQGKLKLHVDLC